VLEKKIELIAREEADVSIKIQVIPWRAMLHENSTQAQSKELLDVPLLKEM